VRGCPWASTRSARWRFAEGHARIAAEHIAARIRGTTSQARYGGRGICYLEFGGGEIRLVDVTFFGDRRSGELVGPSTESMREKAEFGSSRIRRWFDQEWSTEQLTAGSGP
jgi:sulfide:quinone oxidoreductase